MNKIRRECIRQIENEIDEIKGKLEEVQQEEQNALDNMPENLQNSERAEQMEDYISTMETAIDFLDDACAELNEI